MAILGPAPELALLQGCNTNEVQCATLSDRFLENPSGFDGSL